MINKGFSREQKMNGVGELFLIKKKVRQLFKKVFTIIVKNGIIKTEKRPLLPNVIKKGKGVEKEKRTCLPEHAP